MPLLRAGFPQYDLIGGYQKLWVGYRGTRQVLFDLANPQVEHGHHEVPMYRSIYASRNAPPLSQRGEPQTREATMRHLKLVHSTEKALAMSVKIAFASSDRRVVDQHFGAAEAFCIYQLAEDDARLVEVAEFHDSDVIMDGFTDKHEGKQALSWVMSCWSAWMNPNCCAPACSPICCQPCSPWSAPFWPTPAAAMIWPPRWPP